MASSHRALPPLDLLRGFESAARHLSFTRAAAELFLTQSAVSRQIQARETRTGHVLTVTPTVSFASTWLVPRLSRFRQERPSVDVRITETHEVIDMEREGIDVAIRDCKLSNAPPGAVHLVGEHLAAVCSPAYQREAKRARQPLLNPADLRHHVLLTLHDPTGRWPWLSWAAWLEAMGVEELTPAGTVTLDQYDQGLQAALDGQGGAPGRLTLSAQHIRAKRLVALFGRQQRLARAFHAVYSSGARERPEARQLVDWLQQEIKRDV